MAKRDRFSRGTGGALLMINSEGLWKHSVARAWDRVVPRACTCAGPLPKASAGPRQQFAAATPAMSFQDHQARLISQPRDFRIPILVQTPSRFQVRFASARQIGCKLNPIYRWIEVARSLHEAGAAQVRT